MPTTVKRMFVTTGPLTLSMAVSEMKGSMDLSWPQVVLIYALESHLPLVFLTRNALSKSQMMRSILYLLGYRSRLDNFRSTEEKTMLCKATMCKTLVDEDGHRLISLCCCRIGLYLFLRNHQAVSLQCVSPMQRMLHD